MPDPLALACTIRTHTWRLSDCGGALAIHPSVLARFRTVFGVPDDFDEPVAFPWADAGGDEARQGFG